MPKIPLPWFWAPRDLWVVEIDRRRYNLAKGKGAKREAYDEYHRLMVSLGRRDEMGHAFEATVDELFEEFLTSVHLALERGERAQSTYDGYVRFLSSAAEPLGKVRAADLTPHLVFRWCDSPTLKWGPTTRANAITAVKAAYRWAARRRLISRDPIRDMEKPTRRRRELVLTDDQVETVLAETAGTPFADLLTALRESGCRPSEVTTLTVDRVDLGTGTWWVRNKTRRRTGREYRPVYLTPALLELSRRLAGDRTEGLLFRNARGREWTRNAQACAWRRVRAVLGLGAEATSYAVRHRYAMEGLRRGLDASELAALMGHTDVGMLNRVYGHWDRQEERLRAAARRVRPDASSDVASPPPPPSPPEEPPPAP